jgi:ABC-type branched-subunit amino acid transport system substrate-binding protein
MGRLRRALSAAVVLGMAGLVAACGSDAGPNTQAAAKTDGPIELRMSIGLTGELANITGSYLDGINLAIKEVNAAGGIEGREIRLTTTEDKYDTATAVSNTRQFLADKDVHGLIGFGTAPIGAVMPFVCDAGVPMFYAGQVEPRGSCFRTYVNFTGQAIAVGNYLVEKFGPEALSRIALLRQNDDIGAAGEEAVKQMVAKYGLKDFKAFPIEATATDATSQAQQIRAFKPTLIIGATITQNNAQLLKALKQLGVEVGDDGVRYATGDTVDASMIRLAGEAGNGLYGVSTSLELADTSDPRVNHYLDQQAKFDMTEPDNPTWMATGYALGQAYIAGLKGAGKNLTRQSWLAAMEKVSGLPTMNGDLTFGPDKHVGEDTIQIVQIQDGKLVYVAKDIPVTTGAAE